MSYIYTVTSSIKHRLRQTSGSTDKVSDWHCGQFHTQLPFALINYTLSHCPHTNAHWVCPATPTTSSLAQLKLHTIHKSNKWVKRTKKTVSGLREIHTQPPAHIMIDIIILRSFRFIRSNRYTVRTRHRFVIQLYQ